MNLECKPDLFLFVPEQEQIQQADNHPMLLLAMWQLLQVLIQKQYVLIQLNLMMELDATTLIILRAQVR